METALAPKHTQVTIPHRRWRNVYWLARPILLRNSPSHVGGWYGPGRFASRRLWPSKEIAEEKAFLSIAKLQDAKGYALYIGAERA